MTDLLTPAMLRLQAAMIEPVLHEAHRRRKKPAKPPRSTTLRIFRIEPPLLALEPDDPLLDPPIAWAVLKVLVKAGHRTCTILDYITMGHAVLWQVPKAPAFLVLTPWAARCARVWLGERWLETEVHDKDGAHTEMIEVQCWLDHKQTGPLYQLSHPGECRFPFDINKVEAKEAKVAREPDEEAEAPRDARTGRLLKTVEARRDDGRLDVDADTGKVKRVVVTLLGQTVQEDARLGGKKTA